ncbi:S8/S53 family peptidase [Sphingomonas sp. MG17]|uniref:S8/S53 family peptidase n=1 Tax=Sphingomonas tagetis TaxID=2949092 RepID=A0A9X2HIY9_9SPHN|nr:S8/S53 family peptidase [Sphingomonas tagetis]MCP3729786.1 S8/S53 family peptidase [Sphingomonas tagetis]
MNKAIWAAVLALIGVALAGVGAEAEERRPVVAVIDSGVARTAELGARVIAEYDMAASPARPAFQPRHDHGTMVATILARAATAPVDIVSLRIDDPAGCPAGAQPPCARSVRTVAAAIRQATRLKVDAINLSLAMADHPAITDAVRDAAKHGITVVMAAGNDGADHPNNLRLAKAAFPKGVLVGAVDAAGSVWTGTNRPEATGTSGYNYSWQLGVAVPTALADGQEVAATGTSFAAPIETARRLSLR